jgi:hypothetical protein
MGVFVKVIHAAASLCMQAKVGRHGRSDALDQSRSRFVVRGVGPNWTGRARAMC